MAQIFAPFYIPPSTGVGTANPRGIVKVRPQQGMARGEIKLVVISGGPVFMFESEVSAQEAYDKTHGAKGDPATGPVVDFDLAASAAGSSETLKESIPAIMTIASDSETIGFVQFKEDKK